MPQWRESRRRVYSVNGVCPTLHGIGCGGNTEPKIIDERSVIVDDIYNNRPMRFYTDYCPTIRTERTGLKAMIVNE